MKKRIILTLLAMVCTLCCAFGLSACNFGRQSTQQYTVTYDANGGQFSDGTTKVTQTVDEGAKLTAPAAPTYGTTAFGGWAKTASGGTLWNFSSDTVSDNTTLYAVWGSTTSGVSIEDGMVDEEAKTVYLLVDKNTDSVALANKVSCPAGCIWRLYYDKMGSNEIPTKMAVGKSGALENGDNVFYIIVTSQDAAVVDTYELTVHRSYSVEVKYYDSQGELIYTDRADTGHSYKVDYKPNMPGYTFNFWKNEKGDEVTSVAVNGALAFYADCTSNTYTVTLDVSGGDQLEQTEFTVTYGQSVKFEVPTRSGYGFGGWYDGKTQVTDATGTCLQNWSYAGNKTLTAKWNANTYTITLRKDAEDGGSVMGSGDKVFGSRVTVIATTNNGYTWLGWYDEDDEQVSDELYYTFNMGFSVTLTAKWIVCPVTITRTRDGVGWMGTVSGISGATKAGEETTVTAKTNLSGSCNYCWSGWYDEENKLLTREFSYTFVMPSSEDDGFTLNAKWVLAPFVSALVAAGGKVSEVPKVTVVGEELELTATTIKLGYLFQGWFDETDLNNKIKLTEEYTLNYTLTDVGAKRLVARWVADNRLDMFEFESSSATLEIKSVKSNYLKVTELVIPEYVTKISYGALADMTKLEKLTVPFAGATVYKEDSTTIKQGRFFGYIFGGTPYTGGVLTKQYYLGDYYNFYLPQTLREVTVLGGKILEGAFRGCNNLETVVIGDNVTEIYKYAFYMCSGLTNLTLGKGLTKIGVDAFYRCGALTGKIVIPEGITEIEISVFSGCSITGVTLPEGLKSIGASAFHSCALQEIKIPEGVTTIGEEAFLYCDGLTEIVIPDTVTYLGKSAIGWCKNLKSVTLSSGIKTIGDGAFAMLESLEKVNFNGTLTEWLKMSGYGSLMSNGAKLYFNNVELTGEIEIPGEIETIPDNAFRSCVGLTGVTIPAGVKNIGNYIFSGCSALKNVVLPANLTSIGNNAFSECGSLTEIIIPNTVESIGNGAFSGCSALKNVVLPSNLTSIGNGAFSGCGSFTEIVIPASVQSIGFNILSGCSNLESITIPFVGDSIKSSTDLYQYPLGHIFGESSYTGGVATVQKYYYNSTKETREETNYIPEKLKSVTVTGGNLLYGAFYNCSNLTHISVIGSVTSIGDSVFYGCTSLTNITLNDNVTEIGDSAFYGCSALESIVLPNSLETIGASAFSGSGLGGELYLPASVGTIKASAFDECGTITQIYYQGDIADWCGVDGLRWLVSTNAEIFVNGKTLSGEIIIPEGVKTVANYAFYNCSNITKITIPSDVTNIGNFAFYGCTGLDEVILPQALTRIGESSFQGCTGLTSITIPSGVIRIYKYAFYECTNLTSAVFERTTVWWARWDSGASKLTLTDATTAAEYLTTRYADYEYWECTNK